LNEIIGVKDFKLEKGGKNFYKNCISASLRGERGYSDRFYTLEATFLTDDGNLISSSLRLDTTELLFPSEKVFYRF
jgi:hypothetical protein